MEKGGGLKLKLKLGTTPEPPADMDVDAGANVLSDDEEVANYQSSLPSIQILAIN